VTSSLQAVVFDFDGVIADSEPLHLAAFQRTLSDEGIRLTADDYYARYLGYDDVGYVRGGGARSGNCDGQAAHHNAGDSEGRGAAGNAAGLDRCSFRERSISSGLAASAVPIAIASGAMRHEIIRSDRRCRG
jgi:beta-phosphoglucomutase-like phosphatase (HAD superfamily)